MPRKKIDTHSFMSDTRKLSLQNNKRFQIRKQKHGIITEDDTLPDTEAWDKEVRIPNRSEQMILSIHLYQYQSTWGWEEG